MILRIFLILIYSSSVALAIDSSIECIESVCGKTPKASVYSVTASQILAAQKVAGNSLKRPVSKNMGRVIHEALVTDQAFRDLFEMKEFPQIDSNFSALLNAFIYLQRFSDYSKAAGVDAQNRYVINADKLRLQNPLLTDLEQEAILSFNSNLDALVRETSYFKNLFPVALKLKYGNEVSVKSAHIQIAQEIIFVEKKNSTSFSRIKKLSWLQSGLKQSSFRPNSFGVGTSGHG